MPPLLLNDDPPILDSAVVQYKNLPKYLKFVQWCQINQPIYALPLTPDLEPAALTHGLNIALDGLHIELARELLLRGACWDSNTITRAASSFDAIRLLCDFGYDVNSTNLYDENLLRKVICRNDERSIRYLLERGASPNSGPSRRPQSHISQSRPTGSSRLSLNAAAAHSTPEIFALLLEHGAILSDCTALHSAAGISVRVPRGDRIPMLEYLIGLGLNINALDDFITYGQGKGRKGSVLSYAVNFGRIEEAKWLLEHGADPDHTCTYTLSARQRAERSSSQEMRSLFSQLPSH